MGLMNAGDATYSFYDLIEHICATRPLMSGTLVGTDERPSHTHFQPNSGAAHRFAGCRLAAGVGSGPISSRDVSHGFSSIYERRLVEIKEKGHAETPYLKVCVVTMVCIRWWWLGV